MVRSGEAMDQSVSMGKVSTALLAWPWRLSLSAVTGFAAFVPGWLAFNRHCGHLLFNFTMEAKL